MLTINPIDVNATMSMQPYVQYTKFFFVPFEILVFMVQRMQLNVDDKILDYNSW